VIIQSALDLQLYISMGIKQAAVKFTDNIKVRQQPNSLALG